MTAKPIKWGKEITYLEKKSHCKEHLVEGGRKRTNRKPPISFSSSTQNVVQRNAHGSGQWQLVLSLIEAHKDVRNPTDGPKLQYL